MTTVSIAEAKAHLSALLNKVEAGEELVITRHGRAIAQISAISQSKKPVTALAEFRAKLPPAKGSSSELLRRMRDEEL